jgi:hypothetical protein
LIVATSAASLAAPRHHVSPKKSEPDTVAAYLAKCQSNEAECETGVAEARASFKVTQTILHDPDYCVPSADDDLRVLTPKVAAWLKEHPEHDSSPIYGGINAALGAMYPCGQ